MVLVQPQVVVNCWIELVTEVRVITALRRNSLSHCAYPDLPELTGPLMRLLPLAIGLLIGKELAGITSIQPVYIWPTPSWLLNCDR